MYVFSSPVVKSAPPDNSPSFTSLPDCLPIATFLFPVVKAVRL